MRSPIVRCSTTLALLQLLSCNLLVWSILVCFKNVTCPNRIYPRMAPIKSNNCECWRWSDASDKTIMIYFRKNNIRWKSRKFATSVQGSIWVPVHLPAHWQRCLQIWETACRGQVDGMYLTRLQVCSRSSIFTLLMVPLTPSPMVLKLMIAKC